mgnify:CR=1 FL=1
MLKKMKHTFLKFCAALIAFAGLNVFSPDAYAQENTPVGGGAEPYQEPSQIAKAR